LTSEEIYSKNDSPWFSGAIFNKRTYQASAVAMASQIV
jgi:hypothetical protein